MKAQLCTRSVLKRAIMCECENLCQDSGCSISYGLILWFNLLVLYFLKIPLYLFFPCSKRSLVCTGIGIPSASDIIQGKDLNSNLRNWIGINRKLVQCRFLFFGKMLKIFEILSNSKLHAKWGSPSLSLKPFEFYHAANIIKAWSD